MLARLMNDWPLRRQVIVTTGITILVVTLGAAEFIRHLQTRTVERNFEQQSQKLVAMLAATALDAILSEDRPALDTMVSQLATVDPQVEKISIFNEDDLLLSSWSQEASSWKAPLAPRLHFSQNVSLADETFGRIAVTWNVTEQDALIRDQVGMIYRHALSIAVLLGLLLLLVFDAIVTRPVKAIAQHCIRLHESRTPHALRLAGARELHSLTAALNEFGSMLDLKASIASSLENPSRSPNIIETGSEVPPFADLTALELEELVEDSVAELVEQAHAKEVEIITYLTDDVPRTVIGDRIRIHQVLSTLVANAVRFTNTGDVRVHVECVDTGSQDRTLRFSVIDTGIGIEPRLQAGVFDASDSFDPNEPSDPSGQIGPIDRATAGTVVAPDLGLSICRQLVEGMGGIIGVDSRPAQGSVFWFELTLPETSELRPWEPEPALAGRRILLVEGHMHMREHLLGVLRFHGMLADCEASADAGLECLRKACNAGRLHEFVLFDSDLPDMAGAVFTRCIDADPMLDSLRLLSMVRRTGQVVAGELQQDPRVAGWVRRPVKRRELTRLLVSTLDDNRMSGRSNHAAANDARLTESAEGAQNDTHDPERRFGAL